MANGTVTLTGPQSRPCTIKAVDPVDLKTVQVGDLVDMTYRGTLAVSVRPADKQ
jgi:hypothetical protein